jgi:hypothetical protein
VSGIYFHSQSEPDVVVSGRERAAFSIYAADAMLAALGLQQRHASIDWVRAVGRLLRPEPSPTTLASAQYLATHLAVAYGPKFDLGDGRTVDVWACALNTLIASGSDPMILAARLHGQCEMHAYVVGRQREWLSGIIGRGLETGIFREEMGWEAVRALLRQRSDEPVVTSYSVCEQFPNSGVAREGRAWCPTPGGEGDEWYDLDAAQQWQLAWEGLLRSDPDRWLELGPRWREYHFGPALTAYHVAKAAANEPPPL